MINILIVDDNEAIRVGIQKMISDNCDRQISLFEAENGIKAIEIVCSYKIDFIIADIKMPICSGIEMIEKLRELEYQGQIVVLSGFDDYEFVRSAMKLGVADYLLKPIVVDEFINVLEKIFHVVDTQREINTFYLDDKMKYVLDSIFSQQLVFEKLINVESDSSLNDFEEFLICNNIPTTSKVFLCLIDAFNNYNNVEQNKLFYFSQARKVFEELFNSNDYMLIQGETNYLWGILIIIKREHLSTPELFDKFIYWLQEQNLRFGISEGLYDLNKLNDAKEMCIKYLDIYFYDLPDVKNSINESYPFKNIMTEIVNDICNCDFRSFSEKMFELLYAVNTQKPLVEDFKQLLINCIYSIMTQNNEYIGIIGKYKFTEYDICDVVLQARSLSSLRTSIVDIFDIYINELKAQKAAKDEYIIQKAKQFIEHEYMNDITLVDVAERLSLHPNYFSSIFKHKSGTTYRDYLRCLRIQKAKELMKNTDLKIYEIAEKVGYKDTAHFNRAFRHITGKSPSQCKKDMDI